MLVIQIFLIAAVLYVLTLLILNPGSMIIQAWKKLIGLATTIAAVFFIVRPNIANDVAHFFGVQRGADLMLYILIVTFVFTNINIHIRMRKNENNLVKLARRLAILKAQERTTKKR